MTSKPPTDTRRAWLALAAGGSALGLAARAAGQGTAPSAPETVMLIGLFTTGNLRSITAGIDLVQTSGHHRSGVGPARYAFDPAVDKAYVATHPRSAFISANSRGFRLCEPVITPWMLGAEGGPDDTAAVQAAFDTAPLIPAMLMGFNQPLNVGQISVPSGARAQDINLRAIASALDQIPVLIDGRSSAVSDIVLIDFKVDGNRARQTNLTSSGGDGQRAGIAVLGRVSNVSLIRPRVTNCATDGIFLFSGQSPSDDGRQLIPALRPRSDDDYLITDLIIEDAKIAGCGRHGLSWQSLQRARISFLYSKQNGLDLPDFVSGSYGDGGYARRVGGALTGGRYGRAWTGEGAALGQGFDTVTVEGGDFTGNVGAPLVYDTFTPNSLGFVTRKRLMIRGGVFSDNGGRFDQPLTVAQSTTYKGDLPTYETVSVEGGAFLTARLSFTGVKGLTLSGGHITETKGFDHGVTLGNCTDVYIDAPSSKPKIDGLTLPFAVQRVTSNGGTKWTAAHDRLEFAGFLPGRRYRVKYSTTVIVNEAGSGWFDVLLSPGWVSLTDFSATAQNTKTAAPALVAAHPSGTGPNVFAFALTASAANTYAVTVYLTVART